MTLFFAITFFNLFLPSCGALVVRTFLYFFLTALLSNGALLKLDILLSLLSSVAIFGDEGRESVLPHSFCFLVIGIVVVFSFVVQQIELVWSGQGWDMCLQKKGTWESDRVMAGMNNRRVESLKDYKFIRNSKC